MELKNDKLQAGISRCPNYVQDYIYAMEREVKQMRTRVETMDGERVNTSVHTRDDSRHSYGSGRGRVNLPNDAEVIFHLDGGTQEYRGEELSACIRNGRLRIGQIGGGEIVIIPEASNVFSVEIRRRS